MELSRPSCGLANFGPDEMLVLIRN